VSGENAEFVRELFEDFGRGDFDAALAKLDPDVDWGEPPDMPDTGGGYRGREDVVAEFGRFMSAWADLKVDLEDVREVGDRVVVLTRWYGTSKGTGIEVDQRVAQTYELRRGRVARVRQFRALDEALAAAEATP
jgi:ketosteroid isomerase-like protein